MRKGNNLQKNTKVKISKKDHLVVIPIFIPFIEDYYVDALEVFKICIKSLKINSFFKQKIVIISNGSCEVVNNELVKLLDRNFFDELIIVKDQIGKINSILKGLTKLEESFVTISDADIMFLPNWDKAVISIFENCPKAAAVSPIPIFRKHKELTGNIWIDYLFSKKLFFDSVSDPEGMTLFANSIGWPWLDQKFKDVILKLKLKNNENAVVGATHCVATYKKEVFDFSPKISSDYKLGGDSEINYLDYPVLKYGGYRLSTDLNYAYHMGNKIDHWMLTKMNSFTESDKQEIEGFKKIINSKSYFSELKHKLFIFLIQNRKISSFFYRKKGLTKSQIKNF